MLKKTSITFITVFAISTTAIGAGEISSKDGNTNAKIFALSPDLFLIAEKPAEQIRSIELMPNQQLSIDSIINERKIKDDYPVQYFILKNFNQKQQIPSIPSGAKISSKAHVYGFDDHTVFLIEWYDAQYQRLGWHLSSYNHQGNLIHPSIEIEFPRGSINYDLLRFGNFNLHGFTNIQSYERRNDPELRDLLTISHTYPRDRFTGDTYTFNYRKGVLQSIPLSKEQIEEKQARYTNYCTEMFSQFKHFANHNVSATGQIMPLDKSNLDTAYFFDYLQYRQLNSNYEQDLVTYHQHRQLRYTDFEQRYCNIVALRNSLEQVTLPNGTISTQIVLREGLGSNLSIQGHQPARNSQNTFSNNQNISNNNQSAPHTNNPIKEVENNIRDLKNDLKDLRKAFKW